MKSVYSMNADWKFKKEEQSVSSVGGDFDMFSGYTKTGAMIGPASDSFCDTDWATVQLPHDWLVAEPFDPKGAQGAKPRGAAWYRKCFFVPAEWADKRIFLRFEGISTRSAVILNNVCIAKSDSTYTPIHTEITDLLHYGQPNQLAVRTDNARSEGWWYDGCGIYRDVWLTVTEQSCFADSGVFVSAQPSENQNWMLQVRAEVDTPQPGQWVSVTCLDMACTAEARANTELALSVPHPPLWSMDRPNLVPVRVQLMDASGVLDEQIIPFGFRTVQFDAERGCILNGSPVKLKGVCLHQDHAGVGVAISYELHLFRLRQLREMGCNAIRTSHNPQSPDFYRVCDELGFAVMDETRHFGSAQEELRQLREMVRRDRNHPCVFMWSLFNEEPLQCSSIGERIARTMKRIVNTEDRTRPVTGGMNGPLECDGAVHVVDIMGFNYLQYGYDEFHQRFPQLPVIGSETSSYLSQRGENDNYANDQVLRRSAFGRTRSKGMSDPVPNMHKWSDTPGDTWKQIEKRSFVAGGFAWTGLDYRGEARWPAVIADFGAMDLCGFPKDVFYWNRAMWQTADTFHAVRYADAQHPGQAIVLCYTNGNRICLTPEQGTRQEYANDPFDPQPYRVDASIPVTVEAFQGSRSICSCVLVESGEPARLELQCGSDHVQTDDAAVFNVRLLDRNNQVCDTSERVEFSVTGGQLLGVGNGDPSDHEPEAASSRKLYHGCAQAIVRAEHTPSVTVTARCGAWSACVSVPVDKAQVQRIPSCEPWLRICPWRMSDILQAYPSLEQIHDLHFNWIPTMAGVPESLMMSGKQGYACFTGEFIAPEQPCTIHLEQIQGRFDLYLANSKVFSSADEEVHSYTLPVPETLFGQRIGLSMVFICTGGKVRVGETYLTCTAHTR